MPLKETVKPPSEAVVPSETWRQRITQRSELAALRAVASFEAVKGLIAIVAGVLFLRLLNKDLELAAEHLLRRLHVSPEARLSENFIRFAQHATNKTVLVLVFGALVYATVRFVEAYGLWHARDWAEWFALLSGGLYLPWELYEIVRRPTLFHWGILVVNLIVIAFMGWLRWRHSRQDAASARHARNSPLQRVK